MLTIDINAVPLETNVYSKIFERIGKRLQLKEI